MRPTYRLQTGLTLRELTMWKAIVFSLLTLGIYYLLLVYQHTDELQRGRPDPVGNWVLFFVLGIFFPPLMAVLWVFNMQAFKEHTPPQLQEETTPILALILGVVIPPVGQILWASHVNAVLERSGVEVDPRLA